MTQTKTIYSLCDYSGAWSQPYVDAGYNVVRIDLKRGQDVRLLKVPKSPVHGCLCAPLCTMFAISGARWRANEKRLGTYDAKMIEALSVADACVRFAIACGAKWWCLENPVGTLRHYHGAPRMAFNPCDYAGYADEPSAEAYTKKTLLWGVFNRPEPKPVAPTLGSKMHTNYGGKSERTKELRSLTPCGFAQAFFEANP